jgi:signal transduction histidine kinase
MPSRSDAVPPAESRTGTPAAPGDATLSFLQGLPLLSDFPADALERIASLALRLRFPAGAVVMEEGTDPDGLFILMHGELEVARREGGGEVVLAVQGPGTFVGEMSLLERAPRSATVRAIHESEVLKIDADAFHRILATSPGATLTILRTFASRLRSTEASLRQNAKLASLGTLAAGLAHELNNPAAALSRSAAALAEAVTELEERARALGSLRLEPDLLARLVPVCTTGPRGGHRPDSGTLNQLEDDLTGWLDDRAFDPDVDSTFDLAGSLALAGWTPADLDGLLGEDLPAPHANVVVGWLAASCAVAALTDESRTAARTISDIVEAVKAHSYLGQAPLQSVDVRDGLESTLVVLRGRLTSGVDVVRDYAPDLPRIEAYGGELNQVWSNLIDNAILAVEGQGTVEVRTAARPDGVVVEVADTGPGIPPESLTRIFDPFFTTRPPGSGTGLGLHVAYTIVRRHRGSIRVASRPGRTVFTVELPLRPSPPPP